jgi:hypothetical protein
MKKMINFVTSINPIKKKETKAVIYSTGQVRLIALFSTVLALWNKDLNKNLPKEALRFLGLFHTLSFLIKNDTAKI